MKHIISICIITALISSTGFAKTKKVTNVEGRYETSRHISLEQAEQRALEQAKQNALRQAGVPENIWSVFGSITEEDGQKFQEIYSEMSLMATQGLINVISTKFGKITDPLNQKEYATATIDAEVKTNIKTDKTYIMDVNGIGGLYTEGEHVELDFTIYGTDSFLKIFWFDAEGGSRLYPNQYAENRIFNKEVKYNFPSDEISNKGVFDLEIAKRNAVADFERINIMMIATKKDIPYIEDEVTFDSLLKWIYDIPSDQRTTHYQTVIIK